MLEVVAEVAFGHVEIVVVAAFWGQILGHEVEPGLEEVVVFSVDEGAVEPLDEGGIGFSEEAEGLAEFPSGDVQVVGEHFFDDVSLVVDGEIPVAGVDVDEADVPIGICAGESPGAGSGFNGKDDLAVVLGFDPVELGLDLVRDWHAASSGHGWS